MKKIFLLSLLSVLLLSAFSQNSGNGIEILEHIIVTSTIDDEEAIPVYERGIWIFFYRKVETEYLSNGSVQVTCSGWGRRTCVPKIKFNRNLCLEPEIVDQLFEDLVTESYEHIANEEYQGTISKKILLSESQTGSNSTYLFFLMNWKHDPLKPYNGQAEIIISKINNLGF